MCVFFVCVCVLACIYVYAYTHTHIHTCIHTYTYIYIYNQGALERAEDRLKGLETKLCRVQRALGLGTH